MHASRRQGKLEGGGDGYPPTPSTLHVPLSPGMTMTRQADHSGGDREAGL